ncbi:VanW family protein [Thermovenabulum sp.]|uniref:VanW family protein n=1 Tax=Thermovenabulum sp. TaxID=3100335 RepID=UPI003C7B3E04
MRKNFFIILLLCIISLFSAIILIFIYQKNNDILPYNVRIGPIDVSKLRKEEASFKIQSYIEEKNDQKMIFRYNNKKYETTVGELIIFNPEKSIKEALQIKKEEFFLKSFYLDQFNKRKLRIIPLFYAINEQNLQSTITKIEKEICTLPQNARFTIRQNKLQIIDEKEGTEIDKELLKTMISNKIFDDEIVIDLPLKKIKPFYTKEKLKNMNIKYEIASFSTRFNLNQKDRINNIKLASDILNGIIIAPMEVFSFNETVGERTKEKGYRDAPIYFNNEVIQGTGGGVCQISTTLYNLVLLADLEVIERHHHSMPVGYVPPGRDATVSYGILDLKFKNNTGGYLVLSTEIIGNNLVMKFFSNEKFNKKVDIISEIVNTIPPGKIQKIDNNLEVGKTRIEEGRPGCKVKVWKIINYQDKIEKKLVSIDTYKPLNTIEYVGKKPIPSLNQNIDKEEPTSENNINDLLDINAVNQ